MTRIAYQGAPGAYSHLAARTLFPRAVGVPLVDFPSVVRAVTRGKADLAIIPVQNSLIGDVLEAQAALRLEPDLVVVNETTYPIRHCLLALPGAELDTLRWAESHPVALAQCTRWLSARRLTPRAVHDTAGAARAIASDRDYTRAAIAGAEAAEYYGLRVLVDGIADAPDNRTHFVIVARRANAGAAA